jgi:hypothetical protein
LGSFEGMNMRKLVSTLGVGLMLLAAGCPQFSHFCDEGFCDPVGDAGGDGSVADGSLDSSVDAKADADMPPGCDTPNEPLKNPEKCLVDSFGAFVSPTGDDANPGTKAKPFKTIGKALGAGKPRIVACEGEYVGSLDVTTGVSLYGGVSCDFAKAGGRAKITASKAEYGIKIAKVSAAVLFSDVEVLGIAGVAPSESSIGVFVSESTNVQFVRSKIEAADGADAPPKKDGAFTLAASAPKGGDASGNTGGASATTGTCPGGGASTSGRGGDSGFLGEDASPRPPGGAKAPGGAPGDCVAGTGLPGSAGNPGVNRPGASVPASLDASGLLGNKGADGTPGTPGGGGGGGYGTMGAGGAGGAGGCGGQGGFGGGAGGSSIALVSFASAVTLQAVELVAKSAKTGGAGGAGQVGQAGGFSGSRSGNACNGGSGAKGGDGGGGGGGAGGIAAGIAWAGGSEPKRDAQTKIARPAGNGPAGGEGGAVTNKGVDGVHAEVFEVK